MCQFPNCKIPSLPGKDFCLGHNKHYGTVEVKEKKPIRTFSEKREDENKIYEKNKKQYLEENPFCEASISPNCRKQSQDIHHKRKRRSKEDRINPENFLAVCRPCHLWIEANPQKAMELGLSERAIV